MAGFRVEVHKLTDADPDPENANRHTARGQKLVEESLRKRGAFRSLAAFGKGVDRPVIGAGNLTQETAVSIGMDEAIFVYSDGSKPIVHVRTDIAPGSKEARKLALEDNRAAEVSLNWDVGVVAGFDADVIEGLWEPAELSTLGQQWADEHDAEPSEDPGAQVDKAAELQQKWQVQPGDVWTAGAHRIICGDCTDAAVVARVMEGEKAGAVVTDPPYGIGADKKKAHSSIRDNPAWGNADWDHAPNANHIKYIGEFCKRVAIWGGNYFANMLPVSSGWLAWIKPQFGTGFSLSDMELCWTNLDIGPRCKEFNRRDGNDHPTQKPVDLIVWTLEKLNCPNGDSVLDFYGGSGTIIVACERTGRKARMIEIAPAYCAVILERLAGLGLTPTRAG